MSEHVSIETAKALAEAGLRRTEWQVGDWVAFEYSSGKCETALIDEVGELYAVGCEGNKVARLVHLCIWRRMTSGRLRAEGMNTTDTHLLWLPTVGQLLKLLAGEHVDLVEAAGQALLAALKAKEEGK